MKSDKGIKYEDYTVKRELDPEEAEEAISYHEWAQNQLAREYHEKELVEQEDRLLEAKLTDEDR